MLKIYLMFQHEDYLNSIILKCKNKIIIIINLLHFDKKYVDLMYKKDFLLKLLSHLIKFDLKI